MNQKTLLHTVTIIHQQQSLGPIINKSTSPSCVLWFFLSLRRIEIESQHSPLCPFSRPSHLEDVISIWRICQLETVQSKRLPSMVANLCAAVWNDQVGCGLEAPGRICRALQIWSLNFYRSPADSRIPVGIFLLSLMGDCDLRWFKQSCRLACVRKSSPGFPETRTSKAIHWISEPRNSQCSECHGLWNPVECILCWTFALPLKNIHSTNNALKQSSSKLVKWRLEVIRFLRMSSLHHILVHWAPFCPSTLGAYVSHKQISPWRINGSPDGRWAESLSTA